MRPKEVWDKTQGPDGGAGGPRRRASQTKKEKPGSSSQQTTMEDASGGSVLFSDDSPPADATDRPSESQAPQPPAARRPRASSVQPEGSNYNSTKLNESSAAAALQRAIQSSPIQCRSTQHAESAGKNLTPKPTRRILFPSPMQREQRKATQGNASDCGNDKHGSSDWRTRVATIQQIRKICHRRMKTTRGQFSMNCHNNL